MISTYFANAEAARGDIAARTGRHYLIGVYCAGKTLRFLYERGIGGLFWQSGSSLRTGSGPPDWPWHHARRWQYQGNRSPLCSVNGTDPEVDRGDGGTWTLTNPLAHADTARASRVLAQPVLLPDSIFSASLR
jgi:hypothetical protein